LTCNGELSRNRQLGLRLARGERAEEIAASQKAVAEGYMSARPVYRLAEREGVEMPIAEAVYRVCYKGADVGEEAAALMRREMKDELAGVFAPR
ncbi:MAG: NAD(P)H-dependent glycerol-3-phosphate dehydrogenase, partial [Myxococcota bacterium]